MNSVFVQKEIEIAKLLHQRDELKPCRGFAHSHHCESRLRNLRDSDRQLDCEGLFAFFFSSQH
jgi:hypothetical protein